MLIVMQQGASQEQIDRVAEVVREMGPASHPLRGTTRTAIGINGNTGAVDPGRLEVLPAVLELIRVSKPYKLARLRGIAEPLGRVVN